MLFEESNTIGDRRIHRLHVLHLQANLRDHDEVGELPGQQVKRNERHAHQKQSRHNCDKHVRDDQPVPQPPKNLGLQKAKGQDHEEKDREKAQESNPAAKSCARGDPESRKNLLHHEERQRQSQRVPCGARDSRLRPQSSLFQSVPQDG